MAHIINALEGDVIPTKEGLKIYLCGRWLLQDQVHPGIVRFVPTTAPKAEDIIHQAPLTVH